MVFTVNPADAQAMQEDQTQLLGAIAQASRGILSALEPSNSKPSPEGPQQSTGIRIQMGRRVVYGQLARGSFRNELDSNRLKAVFDALQKPVTEGVDAELYRNKTPNIEIRDGETVLFREERDGTVTVNQIQFKLQQQSERSTPQTAEAPESKPDSIAPPLDLGAQQAQHQSAQELRVLASAVLDLQGVTAPDGDRHYQTDNFTVTRDHATGNLSIASSSDRILNSTKEGEILEADPILVPDALAEIQSAYQQAELLQWQMESDETPPTDLTLDWHAQDLQADDIAGIAKQLLNPLGDNPPRYTAVSIGGYQITQNSDGFLVTRGNADIVLIVNDNQVWDYSSTRQDWEKFQQLKPQLQSVVDRSRTTQEDAVNAIAVAEREAAKLPDSGSKQLLQTMHQDWKQQVLQGVGQGVRETVSWLTSRPAAMRDQKVARAALDLFQRGYDRTQEKSYEVGDFKITLQGTNLYSLQDAQGELMRFRATQSGLPNLGRRAIQVVQTSDRLSETHQRRLQTMQRTESFMPLGDLDAEAHYGAKTQQVENTVKSFLKSQNAIAWDKEGGRFKFETRAGSNFLRIVDKRDGRGEIYRRENGRVTSKLQSKDFAHFERLASHLQSAETQQTTDTQKSQNRQKQSPGMELS
jgi:hypothetical protein